MEFLGIGPLELLFIILIALIVLGPNDMVKAGKTMGRWLRRLVTSEGWQIFQQTSRDLRYLPNKLMREAGIDEINETLRETAQDLQVNQIGSLDIQQEIARMPKSPAEDNTPAPVIDSPPPPSLEAPLAAPVEETGADTPPSSSGENKPSEQNN
jgi:sec-independent protein translocase protein TatB